MGNLVKINRAQKRRDKKYNPYKNNPLDKALDKAVSGKDFQDAIEKDKDGNIKLDAAGKPVFKDVIEWESSSAQIHAIWECIKILLDQRLVPPMEIDAAFDLLEVYAMLDRPRSTKQYKISLPINYFVGTWHILNTTRKFGIFSKDHKMETSITDLTFWFADKIDQYHQIKKNENIEEEVKPSKLHMLESPKNVEQKVKNHYANTNTKQLKEK